MVGPRRVNTKKDAHRVLPVPLVAALVMTVLLGLSYLWIHERCESLARDIKKTEERIAEAHRRVVNEEYKWSNLCTLRRVRESLAAFHIEMTWPEEGRVVHLTRALDFAGMTPLPEPQFAQSLLGGRRAHD